MKSRNGHALGGMYLISFIFGLSLAFTAYTNSTFLSNIISAQYVGLLYALGSIVTLICLTHTPRLLNAIGNRKSTLVFLILNMFSLIGLATAENAVLVSVCFIIYLMTNNCLIYCFDIFVEHYSKKDVLGKIRGIYLTIGNAAWFIAPICAGVIIRNYGYPFVYGASLMYAFLIFFMVIFNLRHFKDRKYFHPPFEKTWRYEMHNHSIFSVTAVYFILQFFYAWMIIYMPIYLHNVIGFDWETIGIMFTIMLSAFVILDIPLGKVADKWGEKEFLNIGLVIMAVATISIGFIHTNDLLTWIFVLFMTRVGAAIVEIMSEIYFFKKITDANADILSIFRDTTPAAFIISPIIATILLLSIPFNYLFVVLGIVVICGLYFGLSLKDTN